MAQRLTSPFVFITQVRTYDCLYAKSSNRCLVQLPRPHCVVSLLCSFVNIAHELLLLSGDMEENPVPTTCNSQTDQMVHAMLSTLEAGQAAILAELKSINARLTNTEQTLADIAARIVKTENQCKLLPDLWSDVDNFLTTSMQMSTDL